MPLPRYIGSPSFDSSQPYLLHVQLSREPTPELMRAGVAPPATARAWTLLALLGFTALTACFATAKRVSLGGAVPFGDALGDALGGYDPDSVSIGQEDSSAACSSGFPPGFIWGLGTAAYQIEGGVNATGREPSIWDAFSHTAGRTHGGDTGDVADDHLHRWRADVALLSSVRTKHYRLSISWPRVMSWDQRSGRMVPNEPGLAWYDALLDGLIGAGITPHVTLYHWDLPLALHRRLGGWHTAENTPLHAEFEAYARLCFGRFGGRVATWFTFNEPWTVAVNGYASGSHAPGCAPSAPYDAAAGCPNGDVAPYVVAHNILNAHARAVAVYRADFQSRQAGKISITLNCEVAIPASASADDVAAAERANEFMLGWWLQPIISGEYPTVMRAHVGGRLPRFSAEQARLLVGSIDVLALNHYSSHLVRAAAPGDGVGEAGGGGGGWMADQKLVSTFGKGWARSASPWLRSHPAGIRTLLRWAARRWSQEIYITENGWSCNSFDADAAGADTQQVAYLSEYTRQVRLAIRDDAIDVGAYFAWSLLDNFEWADGYSKRFGLFYVDYATQARTPKAAARWWNASRAADC